LAKVTSVPDGREVASFMERLIFGIRALRRDPGVKLLAFSLGVLIIGAWWLIYLVRPLVWDASLGMNTGLAILTIAVAGLFPLPVAPRIKAGMTTAPLFLAVLALPPGAAALAAVVGGQAYQLGLRFKPPVLRLPWYKYPFNAGSAALSNGAASWVFHLIASDNDLVTPAVLVPVFCMYMLNSTLVSLAVSIQLRLNPIKIWWQGSRENGLAEISLFAFGYIGAVAYAQNPWVLLALIIPVVIIYFTFSRLADTNARLGEALEQVKGLQGQLLQHAKLATLGALTLDLGHQLKNPLFIISGQLESLQRRFLPQDPLRDRVDKALQAAWRINELSEAFLTVGRQQDVKLDVVAVLEEAIGMSTTQTTKRINVNRTYEASSLQTQGNPILLREALSNLVSNAVEAVPPGGNISVFLGTSDGYVSISIRDDGPGIPRQQMARLFEPFNTSKKHGSGLGLFSAKNIVELHHGRVTVQSDQGKGTMVEVVLPVIMPQGGHNDSL